MSPNITGNEKRVTVTETDNDVTTSVAGADGWQTIWDLSPDTDIYYLLFKADHPRLSRDADGGNLRIRMQLPEDGSGSTEIGGNAKVRLIKQGPEEEDVDQLGSAYRYRRFANADQYDNEDVVRLNVNRNIGIAEAGHLKLQVDNSTNGTDVDLSQTGGYAEVELFRGVER